MLDSLSFCTPIASRNKISNALVARQIELMEAVMAQPDYLLYQTTLDEFWVSSHCGLEICDASDDMAKKAPTLPICGQMRLPF